MKEDGIYFKWGCTESIWVWESLPKWKQIKLWFAADSGSHSETYLFVFPVHKQEIKIEILKGKSGSKSRSKKVMQQQPKKPDSSYKHFTCNCNTYIHIQIYVFKFFKNCLLPFLRGQKMKRCGLQVKRCCESKIHEVQTQPQKVSF